MVESLEDEIAEYELETGRQPTATTLQVHCHPWPKWDENESLIVCKTMCMSSTTRLCYST